MQPEPRYSPKREKGQEARGIGLYLIEELCDLRARDIAERFGMGSYEWLIWAEFGTS